MPTDLTPFFNKYEALVEIADRTFRRISTDFGDCVACNQGCCDCCHAMFDIPLIEALYLHRRFRTEADEKKREGLLEIAARTDRKIYRIRRAAIKAAAESGRRKELLSTMSTERVRCPLLNSGNRCNLYAYRPITCRLYGIPTAIEGIGKTCGLSRFKPGVQYPTVRLEIFHRRLYEVSLEVLHAIGSSRVKMAEVLVPLSTALLTDLVEELLAPEEEDKKTGG